MKYFVLAVVFTCTAQGSNREVLDMYKTTFKGKATYHEKESGGSCTLGPDLPPAANHSRIKYLVAINKQQYLGAMACGMCFKVRANGEGTGSSSLQEEFSVFVKDVCPDCQEGDLDIATVGDGIWDIEIQAAQCPVGRTEMQYKFQGSNEWYIKLQIRNARVPVDSVKVRQSGGSVAMNRTADGFWVLEDTKTLLPLRMLITSVTGETITDAISEIVNDVVINGGIGAQFRYNYRLPQI